MVYSRYSTNERVVVESTLYQLATVYVRDNNKKNGNLPNKQHGESTETYDCTQEEMNDNDVR